MTKRLILIRHAKSGWDDPFADDHARILNKRGRASALAVGGWLADQGYIPQTVLCSDAARTQETAELILPQLVPAPKLKLSGMLYHAAPDTIMDLVQRVTDLPTPMDTNSLEQPSGKGNAEPLDSLGHRPPAKLGKGQGGKGRGKGKA